MADLDLATSPSTPTHSKDRNNNLQLTSLSGSIPPTGSWPPSIHHSPISPTNSPTTPRSSIWNTPGNDSRKSSPSTVASTPSLPPTPTRPFKSKIRPNLTISTPFTIREVPPAQTSGTSVSNLPAPCPTAGAIPGSPIHQTPSRTTTPPSTPPLPSPFIRSWIKVKGRGTAHKSVDIGMGIGLADLTLGNRDKGRWREWKKKRADSRKWEGRRRAKEGKKEILEEGFLELLVHCPDVLLG